MEGERLSAGTDGEKGFKEGPLVSDFRGIGQARAGNEGGDWEVRGQMKTQVRVGPWSLRSHGMAS